MPGIPKPERLVARLLVWRWCRVNPPSTTVAILRGQQGVIAGLVEGVGGPGGEAATARVQIRRIPGLEAVSTNYSLAMVAHHLALVNDGIAALLHSFADGERSALVADPALYKPDPGVGCARALEAFDASIDKVESAIARPFQPNGAPRRTHPHPWFGELPATTWACFPAFHGEIHVKQARLIARGLGRRREGPAGVGL